MASRETQVRTPVARRPQRHHRNHLKGERLQHEAPDAGPEHRRHDPGDAARDDRHQRPQRQRCKGEVTGEDGALDAAQPVDGEGQRQCCQHRTQLRLVERPCDEPRTSGKQTGEERAETGARPESCIQVLGLELAALDDGVGQTLIGHDLQQAREDGRQRDQPKRLRFQEAGEHREDDDGGELVAPVVERGPKHTPRRQAAEIHRAPPAAESAARSSGPSPHPIRSIT